MSLFRPSLCLCVLATLLTACASNNQWQSAKVDQSGTLRVHPGLLGKPVPDELKPVDEPKKVAQATGSSTDKFAGGTANASDNKAGMDKAPLRTQRSVYFDFKDAEIKPDHEPMLEAHGDYLAKNPKTKVRVEGNADERGSEGYNKRLGQQRAENVRRTLISKGASEAQVRIVSLGESKPKEKGHDESSWAENRRADIVYEREE